MPTAPGTVSYTDPLADKPVDQVVPGRAVHVGQRQWPRPSDQPRQQLEAIDLAPPLKIKQLEMLCRESEREIARLTHQLQDQTRLMEKLISLHDQPQKVAVPLRIWVVSMLPSHSHIVRILRRVGWLRRLARRLVS